MSKKHTMATPLRAMLGCVAAIVLSVVMIIYTSYAWFTDDLGHEQTERITGGTLGISLFYAGLDELSFHLVSDDIKIFDCSEMRPGYSVGAKIKAHNSGSLELKYSLVFQDIRLLANGVDVTAPAELERLLELFAVTIDDQAAGTLFDYYDDADKTIKVGELPAAGDCEEVKVVVTMSKDASNDEQKIKILFDILLSATQEGGSLETTTTAETTTTTVATTAETTTTTVATTAETTTTTVATTATTSTTAAS